MAGRTQPDAAQALAVRQDNGGMVRNSLADDIRKMEVQFQMAMPRGAEAARLVRDALTAVRNTRNLDQCDSASVLGALMTCAQLGLRPGVLGQAWVLPYWDRKANEGPDGRPRGGYRAQFVIGYQGLIELAHRSPKVSGISARIVRDGDVFDVDYGIADTLVHKPNPDPDAEEGQPLWYYAVVKYSNGGYNFYVMSRKNVERWRDRYAGTKNKQTGAVYGPWAEQFDEMALKTVLRRLAKWMPKGSELAVALAADGGVRVDLRPDADPAEATEHVHEAEVVEDAKPEAAS